MTATSNTTEGQRSATPLEAAAIRFLLVAQLMVLRFQIEPADITVTLGEGEVELERINLAQASRTWRKGYRLCR